MVMARVRRDKEVLVEGIVHYILVMIWIWDFYHQTFFSYAAVMLC